jgi:hypothetical protein
VEEENFNYTPKNLNALISDDLPLPVDYKIAFGSDGQTGYIVMIGNNGDAEEIEGYKNLYPIIWKTTDAGDTWIGPNFVQLDGINGIASIVESHLSFDQIHELYGNNPPPREEISYTTANECDIVVDKANRIHIAVVIGPTGSEPYSIVSDSGFIGVYDLFYMIIMNPFVV